MKTVIGQRFSIAPLRPVKPGRPGHGTENFWRFAYGFPLTRRLLTDFYGDNTQEFADWLAELYWRARKNVVPDDGDTKTVTACTVKGKKEGAPFAAAWLLELLFTGGARKPSWACALETVQGPALPNAELVKMAQESKRLSAWLYHRGMELAYRRAEKHSVNRIRYGMRKALRS